MKRLQIVSFFFILSFLLFFISPAGAQSRRPIDNEHPLWMIHIDVWNAADPQKIIDLVPDDIKPWGDLFVSRVQKVSYQITKQIR